MRYIWENRRCSFNSFEQCMFWNRTFGHNMIITYNGQDLFIVYGFMYLCTFFYLKSFY